MFVIWFFQHHLTSCWDATQVIVKLKFVLCSRVISLRGKITCYDKYYTLFDVITDKRDDLGDVSACDSYFRVNYWEILNIYEKERYCEIFVLFFFYSHWYICEAEESYFYYNLMFQTKYLRRQFFYENPDQWSSWFVVLVLSLSDSRIYTLCNNETYCSITSLEDFFLQTLIVEKKC